MYRKNKTPFCQAILLVGLSVAVTDSTGKVVMESILETKAATILQFFCGTAVVRDAPSGMQIGESPICP